MLITLKLKNALSDSVNRNDVVNGVGSGASMNRGPELLGAPNRMTLEGKQ